MRIFVRYKSSNWSGAQKQIVFSEVKMFGSSKIIKIVALVQLNLVLLKGSLICEYSLDQLIGYTCNLSANQSIINGGEHIGKLSDIDVKKCDGKQTPMEKFPPICEKFRSLVQILLCGSALKFFEADSFNGCTHLQTLIINKNNLVRTLPGMFLLNSELQHLDMSTNKISQLHSETFNGLATLERLDLHGNRLKVLHTKVFAPLTNLKRLCLDSNQISRVLPETFAQTINLEHLSLKDNQLRRLNVNAFGPLRSLEEFHFTHNHIDEIDSKIFEKLSGIKFLYAKGNCCIDKNFFFKPNITYEIIPFLSDCFANWNKKICKFSNDGKYACTLSGLELTKSDESLTGIQFQHKEERSNEDVVRITAADSVINFLPERLLGMFGNLQHIALNNVQLRELSGHFLRNCSLLGVVDLGRNAIETLFRGTFTDCRNLQQIILKSNQIDSIEKGTFAELSKLTLLDLSFNLLTAIPPAVTMTRSLSSLKSLYFSGNRIETLASTSLQLLGGLKFLRLDSNSIAVLNPEALANLQELHLQHNCISEIKLGSFGNTSKLEYLNLEGNSIRSLHSNMFGELLRLRYLDISSNQIRFIDEEIFNSARNLEFLFATDNACVNANFEFEKRLTELETPFLLECFEKL